MSIKLELIISILVSNSGSNSASNSNFLIDLENWLKSISIPVTDEISKNLIK